MAFRFPERWHRAWRESGEAGVLSKGPPVRHRLSEAQIARLERELERVPPPHGWADQRWTPARIKTLTGRVFHVSSLYDHQVDTARQLPGVLAMDVEEGAAYATGGSAFLRAFAATPGFRLLK